MKKNYTFIIFVQLFLFICISMTGQIDIKDDLIKENLIKIDLPLRFTNGTVASYDPKILTPTYTPGTTYPYIDGVDKAGKIVNICKNQKITLTAPKGTSRSTQYRWYKSVATRSLIVNIGEPAYTWSAWTSITDATSNTYDIVQNVEFAYNLVLHIVYYCEVLDYPTTKRSGIVGVSRAQEPTIKNIIVTEGNYCQGGNGVIQSDFDVTGDQVTIKWQNDIEGNDDWKDYSNYINPFSFPADSYRTGPVDYRLSFTHTCGTYYSPTLKESKVQVELAANESYKTKTAQDLTISACLNSEVTLSFELDKSNPFHSDTHTWQYSLNSGVSWITINDSNNGLFSNYNTLNLKVKLNDTKFHNALFRCTTIGFCKTITSQNYTIKMSVPPVISSITSSVDTACAGESVIFTANTEANPLALPIKYRWTIGESDQLAQDFSTNNKFTKKFEDKAIYITCEAMNDVCGNMQRNIKSKQISVYKTPTVKIDPRDASCGGLTVNLYADAKGGKKPYNYLWTLPNGQTTDSILISNKPTNLSYKVSASDACGSVKDTTQIIASSKLLELTVSKNDVLCNGQSNGSLNLEINGGGGNYNLTIKKLSETDSIIISQYTNSNETKYPINSLSAGEYLVELIDVCNTKIVKNYTIQQPDVLLTNIINIKQVNCFNGGDGSATVSVIGGVEPYYYTWGNGQRNKTAQGLFAGKYVVNTTDNNGCLSTAEVTITQPEKLDVFINKTDLSCYQSNNGKIAIETKGGTSPYIVGLQTENNILREGTLFDSLSANIYTIKVTDACEDVINQNITINQPNALDFLIESKNSTCKGYDNGSITVTILHSMGEPNVKWSNEQVGNALYSLTPGQYTYTISDNCTQSTDTIEISEPEELTSDISKTDIQCQGKATGAAYVTVSGGTYPMNFTWNNGMKSQSIENVFAGNYTIQIVDANNCITMNSVTIEQTPSLVAIAETKDVTCANDTTGSIEIKTYYGAEPITYQWSNVEWNNTNKISNIAADNYKVTVTDYCNTQIIVPIEIKEINKKLSAEVQTKAVSCYGFKDGEITIKPVGGLDAINILWNTNSTSLQLKNLEAGTYTYTLTDACKDTVKDTILIAQPYLLTADIETINALCYKEGNGSAKAIAKGGVAPYIYNWSIGLQSDQVRGLFAGNYSVNIFDANGCFANENFSIQEPSDISIIANITHTTCNKTLVLSIQQ
ncbi:MAG: SprB repeat-containing protein [Bacteroidales bacterium]|nr:SprB repeat-containing protein [Bacteroidales bacterium]